MQCEGGTIVDGDGHQLAGLAAVAIENNNPVALRAPG